MSAIGAIAGPSAAAPALVERRPREANGFAALLDQAVGQAEQHERAATAAADGFAAGDPTIGIHETMIAAEKASVSLRYATTLKNKLVDAYRELMSTPV